MAESLQNIVWMAEELDFSLPSGVQADAEGLMRAFITSAGNPDYSHSIVRPSDNVGGLSRSLQEVHDEEPFTAVVDLTGGDLASRLPVTQGLPAWNDFSMSRVRMATKPGLPTSGYLVSHNTEEIATALEKANTEHLLVVDDTAFSGSTSVLAEEQIRQALPDRTISVTHGFLILNVGELGPQPGPKQRLEALGSRAIGGMEIQTPRDDGWHFFDLVRGQGELSEHLAAVMGLVHALGEQGDPSKVEAILSNEATLAALYPNKLTSGDLEGAMRVGRFIGKQALNGGPHTRNPQLLPTIIEQRHLLPPSEWRDGTQETLGYLEGLAQLIKKEAHA